MKARIIRRTNRRKTEAETPARHGHLVTPGSAEGDLDVVEAALRGAEQRRLQSQGGRRPSQVQTAGNRKRAA